MIEQFLFIFPSVYQQRALTRTKINQKQIMINQSTERDYKIYSNRNCEFTFSFTFNIYFV